MILDCITKNKLKVSKSASPCKSYHPCPSPLPISRDPKGDARIYMMHLWLFVFKR